MGMTTTLSTPATPTRQLHWDDERRQWIGEISSTHGFGRVFSDSCDEGLTLVGRSGKAIEYVVERTEVRDGEIVAWTLSPVHASDRHVGGVYLFND